MTTKRAESVLGGLERPIMCSPGVTNRGTWPISHWPVHAASPQTDRQRPRCVPSVTNRCTLPILSAARDKAAAEQILTPRHRSPCLCPRRSISGWSLCPTFFLKALRLSDDRFVTRPMSPWTGATTVPPKVPRQCRGRRFRCCMARQFPDEACRRRVQGVTTPPACDATT
jgi:hypothetical protein